MVVAVAMTVAGCGSSEPEGAAKCREAIVFQGRTYYGTSVATAPSLGGRAGTAEVPPCDDGSDSPEEGQVDVRRIKGIDARFALAAPERSTLVYLANDLDEDDLPPEVRSLLGR